MVIYKCYSVALLGRKGGGIYLWWFQLSLPMHWEEPGVSYRSSNQFLHNLMLKTSIMYNAFDVVNCCFLWFFSLFYPVLTLCQRGKGSYIPLLPNLATNTATSVALMKRGETEEVHNMSGVVMCNPLPPLGLPYAVLHVRKRDKMTSCLKMCLGRKHPNTGTSTPTTVIYGLKG